MPHAIELIFIVPDRSGQLVSEHFLSIFFLSSK